MNAPVVVQGTAVVPPSQTATSVPMGGTGVSQPNESSSKTGCRDPIFAILFYINIAAIGVVVVLYGGAMTGGEGSTGDLSQYIAPFITVGILSLLASAVGLFLLMTCPEFMIKAGLIFSLVIALLWAVYAFLSLNMIYGIMGVVFFAFTACYVRYAWSRIPFAAINMVTAGTAIKANLGVSLFAIFFTLLQLVWMAVWAVAFIGVSDETSSCDANGVCSPSYGLLFLLFLSLFFTQQVLESCVHVTVAGTVGTWWVAPDESGCCSRAVCNSFIRTVTTSFGSICFGSLLVAILQALRALASTARQSDECALVACIFECILECLASILEYFNKWAFIYVGVYGFGYIESGKNVMQLFKNRGWEAIIADDLVGGAIFLMCIMVSLIIGGLSVALTAIGFPLFNSVTSSTITAFFIGFIPSLLISLILLSTISSGVNTVIVMFAEAPAEFENNHPELSAKMRAEWQKFYPGSV